MKKAIGVLDMGVDNIHVLNAFAKAFKTEHFIYVNDLQITEYEGLEVEKIQKRVEDNVNFLLTKNIKFLVVVSNTIIEYCRDYLNTIPVNVIFIVDSIIHYVNRNYEHKNMVFLASKGNMQANIYQKHFKYNHLYSIVTNQLDKIIRDDKIKTSESFTLTRELLKTLVKKEVDILIPTTINMNLLKTEFQEYIKEAIMIDVSELLVKHLQTGLQSFKNYNNLKNPKIDIYINIPKKHFTYKHLLTVKCNIIKRKE